MSPDMYLDLLFVAASVYEVTAEHGEGRQWLPALKGPYDKKQHGKSLWKTPDIAIVCSPSPVKNNHFLKKWRGE